MTKEQFENIKWKFSTHLAMEDCHSTVYVADTPFSLLRCARVPTDKYGRVIGRRTTVHYMLNGKVVKSKKKLLEAIKEL